jgi:ribosome-binding ATPase
VPDPRLDELGRVVKVAHRVPTTIEFVDIAGLVKGAAQGEGLGNKFLSHIREVDAIIHVVRCFEDPDIHHVTGAPDPVQDIGVVTTELVLADLEAIHRRRERISREFKGADKHAVAESQVLDKLEHHLDSGQPAITAHLFKEEWELARPCGLLTSKPTLFAANLKETDLAGSDANPLLASVKRYGRSHHGCDTVEVCAQLESDLADLSAEEAAEYLGQLGVAESGVSRLIAATYRLLDLRTFFTFNETEVRAWTIRAGDTAVRAAGRIHTDFEKGFIKAEAVLWEDLVKCGSVGHAREGGLYRIEGRDYVVRDGDVLLFKFH